MLSAVTDAGVSMVAGTVLPSRVLTLPVVTRSRFSWRAAATAMAAAAEALSRERRVCQR